VLDTTEATTDAQDAQLNESCGFYAIAASVWYTFEGNDADMDVETRNVGTFPFSPAVIVGVGSPGSLQTVACGIGRAEFHADSGTTYYILAFDMQFDETINGGILEISFIAVPVPTVEITINPKGTASRSTGATHISGSYTCTNAFSFNTVTGSITQTVRGYPTTGEGLYVPVDGICNGVRHTWETDVLSYYGPFRVGAATVEATLAVCGQLRCALDQASQTVKLSLRR
jgi:hypothetical protein